MNNKFPATAVSLVVSFIIIVIMAFGSMYQIDEKERGVILRNGKEIGLAAPGLHFKMPFIDEIKRISVQNHTTPFNALAAYSNDQQAATLRASVSWHVEPGQVSDLYKQYSDLDVMVSRLIARHVPTQVENVFGKYTAIKAVQNRPMFVTDVTNAIKASINGPVIIDSVQIENIDFSKAYEDSIEERMKAEVQVETRKQQKQTEIIQGEIQVVKANAEADSNLARATAEAEAIKLRGQAEAEAISLRAKALSSNENLVELTKAERWDGKLPTTVLPGGTLPFIDTMKRH